MNELLAGKVALVTGAGSGIGKATALAIAAEGAKVVVNELNLAHAESVVAEIVASDGSAIAVAGNVTNPDDV